MNPKMLSKTQSKFKKGFENLVKKKYVQGNCYKLTEMISEVQGQKSVELASG